MSISAPFIERPVATTLLTIALGLSGAIAYTFLPVNPLPQVEFPTISVGASLPGASPETMATSVATPLERSFGRIASVTEMTSTSYLGSTSVTLQFDLNRSIDAAARDVQAAINAARSQLPANLPYNPIYRKVNPADAPILILALQSNLIDGGRMYDAASSILAQKLAQVQGVGQVFVGGGALPGVRVELNPTQLNHYGVNLEDVRNMLANSNANRPKGEFGDPSQSWAISTTDQILKARDYAPLFVNYQHLGAIRLQDVGEVVDSVEDLRNAGIANGVPAIQIMVNRQPAANIIATVDRVKRLLPQFQAEMPQAIQLVIAVDRSTTIRASVHDVEITMMISIVLVILVVFVFLRSVRTTLIPGVSVPISLVGAFGVMYLLGYSIDNLSLMALTISTGFVVDDAIVVIENVTRHLEQGMRPYEAALLGAKEIGFTVVSMSTSLVAVFIPILMMGGVVGRLFREFAVTLSTAIALSLIMSLTTTPMMCAHLLRSHGEHGRIYRANEWMFDRLHAGYRHSLGWVLGHQRFTAAVTLATCALTIFLYIKVPKGFFPQQDTGRLTGQIIGDQDTSFQAMQIKLAQFVSIIRQDPAVDTVVGSVGGSGGFGGALNTGRIFLQLKDLSERKLSSDEVIARLRPKISHIPGASLFLQSVQDLRIGGRGSAAQYQYTLQGDNAKELNYWGPKVLARVRSIQGIVDLNSDQQDRGLAANLIVDRDTASRLGISSQMIDNTLYDAFGQRQVSTMYTSLNQYHVVMEVAPRFWHSPEGLRSIFIEANNGQQIPLSSFARYAPSTTSLAVNHQGQLPSVTLSFNLAPGYSLGDAVNEVQDAESEIALPPNIHGMFMGTAQAFKDSLSSEPLLIGAALIAVYIVLGVLYESLIHPITILSTLPSAGVGALLALLLTHTELSVIALIGIILLIGIVKKNAIMMIDFALETARRGDEKTPEEAIFEAAMLRFRPITMTTMAALLGGLPLAVGVGVGAEMRRPLGIAIVGGLIFSQLLTLYTTPVVYVYLDRVRIRLERKWAQLTSHPVTESS